MKEEISDAICIGAGPAGLTAAYILTKANKSVIVLESDPNQVGGISKTVNFNGYKADIGGHRFFSKSKEVNDLWDDILTDGWLQRPRISRIFYKGKYYDYPLRFWNTLRNLGVLELLLCGLSYLKSLFKNHKKVSLQSWIVKNFGSRLYRHFFKSYTEKVWGRSCHDISASWAAQRIRGLSILTIIGALFFSKKNKIKTLISKFKYPKFGPGMLWDEAHRKIHLSEKGQVLLGYTVHKVEYLENEMTWKVFAKNINGEEKDFSAKNIISSMPLRDVFASIVFPFSNEIHQIAKKLKYRDFIQVALVTKNSETFQDNWLYIHDPEFKTGRIQNFKSWSPFLISKPGTNCLGVEYFCNEDDNFWQQNDNEIILFAKEEVIKLDLVKPDDILFGKVIRQKKAYPVYSLNYESEVSILKNEICKMPGYYQVGRNGQHKYNNQDHAMMTAILASKNILSGNADLDVWNVNIDAEYLES